MNIRIVLLILACCFSQAGFAQKTPANTPSTLGGGSTSQGKITGQTTKVTATATKVDDKPKTLSKREQKEAKSGSFDLGEIESLQIERQLGSAIEKEIKVGEKILPTISKNSEQRPEVMRRLIETYHQKALFVRSEESRRYETNYKKWEEAGRRGTEPEFDERASKAWTSKVIQKAQQFMTEYPNHKSLDDAYFNMAFALDELTQRTEAAGYYSKLVQKFPNSKRVPNAYFSLGEFYFDKLDFKKALDSYKQIDRYSRASIYPWSVYKIAWCYYNLQDYRNSLGQFQKVVELSQSSSGSSSTWKQRLKEEALREMVAVYAELTDVDGAERYFLKVGGEKYYGDLLLRLAAMLRERGDFEKSINVLKRFVTRNPYAFKAAEIQLQIVDTSNKLNDKKILWAEMKFLLSTYRKDAPWGQKNQADPGFAEISDKVHSMAINTAKLMHVEYQKTNSAKFAKETETAYQLYLAYFSERPEAIEIQFLLGELFYTQNKYPEAAKYFNTISLLKEKTKYFSKAADYLLSSAYLPIAADLQKLRAKKIDYGGAPQTIPQGLQDYMKSCGLYIQWFPKDKKVLDCHVDSAEILVKYNQFSEAEKKLLLVARTYPDRNEGKTSASILLRLAVKNIAKPTPQETEKLMGFVDEFIKIPQYQQGDLGKQMTGLKQEFKFEKTMALEKSGNHAKAAQEFEKIGTENPAAKEADKAWFNAGVNYQKSGDIEKSIAAFTKVYTNYPKSTGAADALLTIISMHEDRFDLQKAADSSSLFVSKFPTHKDANRVSVGTCFLYDALNVQNKTVEMCGAIANNKKNTAKADKELSVDAARIVANIYYRNKRYSEYLNYVDSTLLKMVTSPNEQMEILAKCASVEQQLGKASKAAARRGQIDRIYQANKASASGTGLAEVANMSFQKQWPLYERFRGMRITAQKPDGSDLIDSAAKKKEGAVAVEKAFAQVAKIGSPEWSVASLYIIGFCYETLAQEYNNPPRPGKATDDDMKMIKSNFTPIANSFKEIAKKSYAGALSIAGKASVNSDYSKKAADSMARLSPNEFRKLDEWTPGLPFVGVQWTDLNATHKAFEALGGQR